MAELWLAAALWVGTHLGISSSVVRVLLVRTMGQGGYLLLYSLIAAGALTYLIWVYVNAPRFDYLWMPDPDLYWFAKLSMPLAMMLLVGGFMAPKAADPQAAAQDPVRGVFRITRHPMQWAVIIWAVGHIIANGDTVSLLFFSAFLSLSFFGSLLMDHKHAKADPVKWRQLADVSSNIPFAALLSGRNRWAVREWVAPLLVGLVVYAAAYYFHELYTGAVVV
ncbi:MAG: NnrU family protein [bacterium]